MKTLNRNNLLFFILAFIEGGAVMCVELCSAKLLAPYFGTSIYVWAAVLGITLTALMSGYYLGGYLSNKVQRNSGMLWLMLIGGFFVTISPLLAKILLPITINFSLITGSLISLIGLLFLPLLVFGATSPMLIQFLTNNAQSSGKVSGTIYSVSTLGGIITTFLVGFYTLPQFGINATLYGYGILTLAYTAYLFIHFRLFVTKINFILIAAGLSLNFHSPYQYQKLLYESEGILGEVKVIERTYLIEGKEKTYRELLVNNICQTMMDIEKPSKSYWNYVDVLANEVAQYKKGSNSLLLGLGGGTLYKKLKEQNLKIDVVEIDERIAAVAKEYFKISNDIEVIVDDARHYLNVTNKEYDLIIYDLFHSETPPSHLMTKEAFLQTRSKLSKDGLFIINFYGYITGNKGKAARSLYKTLQDCGFSIQLLPTEGDENARNLIFICSESELNPVVETPYIPSSSININDVQTLMDDNPSLEHLYVKAALDWRKNYNEINAKQFLKN